MQEDWFYVNVAYTSGTLHGLCIEVEVKLMAKVNKAFSLDPEVFILLDKYCRSHEEIGGKRWSRSKMVNEAIRWYLGDTANLVLQRDALQTSLRERNSELEEARDEICKLTEELVEMGESSPPSEEEFTDSERRYRPWWLRLLLGR